MKYLFSILSIAILITSCESEKKECSYINDYYQHVYSAEEAYYKGDFQKVVDEMEKATQNCELLNQTQIYEMLKYAEASAQIGETDKALSLVRKLIQNGYKIDDLREEEAFSNLVNTSEWKKIEKEYPKLREEYIASMDLDLRKEIMQMVAADQYHRVLLEDKSLNRDSLFLIINKTDSINDSKLQHIIETKGYPDHRIIGVYNIDKEHVDPGILLFHFDDYDYYTQTLKRLIDQGKAPPQSLGNFVDSYQRRVKTQKRFIYGIYDNVGEDRIMDYDKLDERRVSIGLAPMQLKRSIDSLKKVHYGF